MTAADPGNTKPEEFPSNSYRQKTRPNSPAKNQKAEPEERKIEKVISGPVIQRKRGPGRKFRETFFGRSAKGVFSTVWFDIIAPSGQDLLFDASQYGLEKMVYGETSRGNRRRAGAAGLLGHMAYNQISTAKERGRPSDPRDREQRGRMSARGRKFHDFRDIILTTRREGEMVLAALIEQIDRYQMASVADLYDLLGEERNYTDAKWGWFDLEDARVTHISGRDGGYWLDLPRPVELNG